MKLVKTINVTGGYDRISHTYQELREALKLAENKYIADYLIDKSTNHTSVYNKLYLMPYSINAGLYIQPHERNEIKSAELRDAGLSASYKTLNERMAEVNTVFDLHGDIFGVLYDYTDLQIKHRIEIVEYDKSLVGQLYLDVKVHPMTHIEVLHKKWC